MKESKHSTPIFRGGFHDNWLTTNHAALAAFVSELRQPLVEGVIAKKLHPVIEEYRALINTDPIVRMYVTEMIAQIQNRDPRPHLEDLDEMLFLLNQVLTRAPTYNDTALVGCPMSAILVWTMSTPAGFAAYRNEKINAMLKKILQVWRKFLDSPKSLYVLNDSDAGWKCDAAQAKLHMDDFKHDKDARYWGFKSWNAFFSRKLAKGARPIDHPHDPKVIVSACDSTVHKISEDVQKYSEFWIKSQPYSLNDMLANDKLVKEFVDGIVYQAYLDPFNYHRWHSPVSGKIRKAYVQEGLLFSQVTSQGVDPTAQGHSEEYVAHVQTRAIIYIDADDKDIGLVCVMPVGMVEISSCVIHKKFKEPGQKVKKGEELGYFQFGGSTHCVIFQPGVIEKFTVKLAEPCKVGQQIAIAK